MGTRAPAKVLITGGREVGGVQSFAEGLEAGFRALGIQTEVVSPGQVVRHWRELRDPKVLKILSTTALFAAPFVRRAICMAHGMPGANKQGWLTLIGMIGSYKLTNVCLGTRLVAVSDYTAVHLYNTFDVKIDGVVRNPVKSEYLEPFHEDGERRYITYVGRLVKQKNVHRLLPAICKVVRDVPGLRACIIGDGPQRSELEKIAAGDGRIEFKGCCDAQIVREYLRRTKVFVSGDPTEPLGITYLEALTQGCMVAMPASGGGIEIALDHVGKAVQLLPICLDGAEVASALHRAIKYSCKPLRLDAHTPKAVASAYLDVDARYFSEIDCKPDRRHY